MTAVTANWSDAAVGNMNLCLKTETKHWEPSFPNLQENVHSNFKGQCSTRDRIPRKGYRRGALGPHYNAARSNRLVSVSLGCQPHYIRIQPKPKQLGMPGRCCKSPGCLFPAA